MAWERRSAPRVVFGGEVLALLPQRNVICRGIDLSTTGMRIRPSSSVTGGAFIRVAFSLPDTEHEDELARLELCTLVVREGGAWALKFVQAPDSALRLIDRHVCTHLPRRRARDEVELHVR